MAESSPAKSTSKTVPLETLRLRYLPDKHFNSSNKEGNIVLGCIWMKMGQCIKFDFVKFSGTNGIYISSWNKIVDQELYAARISW